MAEALRSTVSPCVFSLFGKSTEIFIKPFSHFGQAAISELFMISLYHLSIMCSYWRQHLKLM